MDGQIITIIAVAIPVLGFLWIIHRDVAGLRERMARLEGLFAGFANHSGSGRRRPANNS